VNSGVAGSLLSSHAEASPTSSKARVAWLIPPREVNRAEITTQAQARFDQYDDVVAERCHEVGIRRLGHDVTCWQVTRTVQRDHLSMAVRCRHGLAFR
jgi:hypothetical protein